MIKKVPGSVQVDRLTHFSRVKNEACTQEDDPTQAMHTAPSCSEASFAARTMRVHELLQTFSHKLRIDTWVPDVGEKEGAGVKVGGISSGFPRRRKPHFHNCCSCIWPRPIDTRIISWRRSYLPEKKNMNRELFGAGLVCMCTCNRTP